MPSMPGPRTIPQATVARLPLYLRVLREAEAAGTATLSSEELAHRAGVTAAQIRKDLSHLGSYGTRGIGYDVDQLTREIGRRLGLDEELRVAIVGAGNLGQALARYGGFSSRGFRVVAIFDTDPAKVGTAVGDTLVADARKMPTVVASQQVDIALITTPAPAAQWVADAVVGAGVRSILNFAPTTVTVPAGVSIRQVDLGIELEILSFYRKRVAPASVV
jgi:redox-sensing transcriptional repressor